MSGGLLVCQNSLPTAANGVVSVCICAAAFVRKESAAGRALEFADHLLIEGIKGATVNVIDTRTTQQMVKSEWQHVCCHCRHDQQLASIHPNCAYHRKLFLVFLTTLNAIAWPLPKTRKGRAFT